MKKLLTSFLSLALTLSLCAAPASALSTDQARDLLRTYYVDALSEQVLAKGTLDEILSAVGDPYTYYMDAAAYQAFLQSVDGESLVGIGVSIQNIFDNGFLILSVLDDSPALEAGLQPGDRIVAVDGTTLAAGSDPRTAITGEEGTSVTITVLRQADGSKQDYTLTRRKVTVPIVTYEQRDSVGYINCTSFGSSTTDTVEKAVQTLDKDTAVWVMDLRSNPGGTAEAAAGSAGAFVGGNRIMVQFDGQLSSYYLKTTSAVTDLTDKPLIVLTSSYSASGSELFAAAIRDYSGGIGLGQRSFGKGIAQTVFDKDNTKDLFDGDCMKITTHRFYSPAGTTNHIVGVLPTLMISQENTADAALLLSSPQPTRAQGYYKLTAAGQTFYISAAAARSSYSAAFAELLSALPPSATLYVGSGRSTWTEITADELAQRAGLSEQYKSYCNTFTDLDSAEHPREIATLAVYDLVSGFEDGTFRPDSTVTRAEFAAMITAALDLNTGTAASFRDVAKDTWYFAPISAMASMGFLAGYEDGTFRPDNPISYQEMVTILSSVAAWCNLDAAELKVKTLSAGDWGTYYAWADWAQIPARNLTKLGVTLDDQSPAEYGTRDDAAALLCQLMEGIHLLWD